MSDNTDIIALLSTEADQAVDQIIVDAKRLHLIVNGTGTEQAVTEDGSLIPSVRKALIDNLYFKTPPLPWKNGSSVTEFNQLYSFTDVSGNVTWWYAPGATVSTPVNMKDSPINDGKFKVFLDKTNISDIYAPLVSPDFKGNPRVPLAPTSDDTNTIASTQWVKREMKDLTDLVVESTKGVFENITVEKDSVLENLYVNGEFVVNSDKVSAPQAEATFRRVRVVGNAAEIAFEQNQTPPVGINTKTNIKPYAIATGAFNSDTVNAGSANIGDVAVASDSLNVDGYIRGDYLHLEGNNRNDPDKPQLLVDGIAEIGTLRITDKIEGFKADVDGLNINPNGVNITEGLQVGKDAVVAGKLTVSGDTRLEDLEITGTLSGVSLNVDGKDIKPRSVDTGNISATGDVQITGTTTATGKITAGDLEVLGKLTADLDLSGAELQVGALNVTETATIKDLVVTGTTTGLKGDVDGEDISPASVTATGVVSSASIITSGDVSVGGNLTTTGPFLPSSLKTGEIEGTGLKITAGTTTVADLVVTGTTTGVSANIDGTDAAPATIVTSGKVDVGTDLTVAGKSTLGDVEFTGTATGLDIDLSQKDVQVKSVVAVQPSSFKDISTDNIVNSVKITTEDIQVNGQILDSEGEPIKPLDVTGKDILPNSVQSATSVKTKTLEVEQTSTLKGLATLEAGLTITGGNITSAQGKATLNDVQVNGSLTDSNGNAIGTAESIKGKDIEPRSVVAEVSVQAPRLQSTGDILGQSAVITGDTSTKGLIVAELSNLQEVRMSGPTTGSSAEFESLRIKRVAGSENLRFVLEGAGEIQGDLNVTGSITGTVDLSAQDISMNSLQVAENIGGKNITASATVTGANGVFGGSTAPGQFGLQSLSNARITDDLQVGGDLKVEGTITGDFDLSGKDLVSRSLVLDQSLQAATISASTSLTTKDLVVTGTTNFGSESVFTGSQMKSKLFTVETGQDLTVGSGTWTPDGKQSIYNVTVTADTVVNAPAELPGAGTYYFYIDQDSVGGHAVTFAAAYLKIGEETVNTAPSSTSLVQVIYRGKGNTLDYVILRRG